MKRNIKIFHILILFCWLLPAASCQNKSSNPLWQTDQNQSNGASCNGLNLLKEARFTGLFLNNLIHCLSAPPSKLPQVNKINSEFGPQGLQSFVDFLLQKHPDSDALGVEYPYLTMMITFLDRGTHTIDAYRMFHEAERFVELQTFLMQIDPRQAAHLLVAWHRHGQLQALLHDLWQFIDLLPEGSISGILRKSLSDQEFKEQLAKLTNSLLADRSLRASISSILQHENYQLLGLECLNKQDDCQPQALSEADLLDLYGLSTENIAKPDLSPRNFFGHYLQFWQHQTSSYQESLEAIGKQILIDLKQVSIMDAEKYLAGFLDAIKAWFLQAPKPVSQLIQWFNSFLSLTLDELNPLMRGISEVAANPLYVDALQEKAGASLLQRELKQFFWQGGNIPYCNNISFQGLAHVQTNEAASALLLEFINPSSECQGLSPALALALDILQLSCEQNCQEAAQQQAWLLAIQPVKLANEEWQALIYYSMDRLQAELEHDPYYLQHLSLAYGPVFPHNLQTLRALGPKAEELSLEAVLAWDQKITNHPSLKALLRKNFIESWLSEIIFRLDVSSHQLSNIFPAREDELSPWLAMQHDQRLLRTFLGFYEGGPARPWLQKLAEQLMPDHDAMSSDEHRKQKLLRQAFSSTHGLFKNPDVSFQAENEKINLAWSGSLSNQTRIASSGELEKLSSPILLSQLIPYQQEADLSLALWQRLERQLPILDSDEATISQAVQQARQALEALRDPRVLDELDLVPRQYPALPDSLFESTPYTLSQARLLLLFFGQNFYDRSEQEAALLKQLTPNELPLHNDLSRDQAPRILAGVTSTSGTEHSWSAMVQWLPQASFAKGSSLQEWLKELVGDKETLEQHFYQRARQPIKVGLNQLANNPIDELSEHEKLLGLGGLLSFIYHSRSEQFAVPSIGFADYCPKRTDDQSWVPSACPLQVKDYAAYSQWLQEHFLNQLCPVLVELNELPDSQFLHFLNLDANWQQSCDTQIPSNSYVPSILSDIWKLGSKPQLKPGLRSLAIQMRLARLAAGEKLQLDAIDRLRLSLSPKVSARLLQREESYGIFRQSHPGLFSSIIQQLSGLLGDQLLSRKLLELSGSLMPQSQDHAVDLSLQALVDEFQISRLQNGSLLSFAYHLLQRWEQKPELRDAMTALFADPYDPYTGILLGFTMGQAIEAELFPEFSKAQAGYQWLLQSLQADQWQLLNRLAYLLQDDARFLSSYLARLLQHYPSGHTFANDLSRILRFYSLAIYSQSQALEDSFKNLARQSLDQDSIAAIWQIWSKSLYEPFADLNNQWQAPLIHQPDRLVRVLSQGLPQFANSLLSRSSPEEVKLLDAIWPMAKALNAPLPASKQAFLLLQDARLGFRQPRLWRLLAEDQAAYQAFEGMLEELQKIERQDWLHLSYELEDLLSSSYKFLDFASQNITWDQDYSHDYSYALDSLSRLANSEQRKQASISLIRSWLMPLETVAGEQP